MRDTFAALAAPSTYARRLSKDGYTFRTRFERDRDRILYSRPFRRLAGKTQIFVASSHDHVRTRLTHTLEVAQIARTIAHQLKLNEALAESIALGHDLGHTPFGHVGERALNLVMNGCDDSSRACELTDTDKGFKHNLQSVRVATDLTQLYPKVRGLNLTNFTLWGMQAHTRSYWKPCDLVGENQQCRLPTGMEAKCATNGHLSLGYYDIYKALFAISDSGGTAWSFEALIVQMADEIAQRHHDLEDGVIANLVTRDEVIQRLQSGAICDRSDKSDRVNLQKVKQAKNETDEYFVNSLSKLLVNSLESKLVSNIRRNLSQFQSDHGVHQRGDFVRAYPGITLDDAKKCIVFGDDVQTAHDALEAFLRDRILNSFGVHRMDGAARFTITRLFQAYTTNPQQLTNKTIAYLLQTFHDMESRHRSGSHNICVDPEAIGGMRDEVKELFNSGCRFNVALLRTICDHIAGMTDEFAMKEYHQLYGYRPLGSLSP